MSYPYGIQKIIKSKKFKDKELIICKVNGNDLYATILLSKDGQILSALCQECHGSTKAASNKILLKEFRRQLEENYFIKKS